MLKLLIVHYNSVYPVRKTTWDHLFSFRRYSSARCYYYNAAVKSLPDYLSSTNYDAIIFHTSFLGMRWKPALFQDVLERVKSLREHKALKLAFHQDEFIHMDALCNFINTFNINIIYTCYSASNWKNAYRSLHDNNIEFQQTLTGYVDEGMVKFLNMRALESLRTIDIGYRAWNVPAWLGRHGLKKIQIARVVEDAAIKHRLKTDISTKESDTFLGNSWYDYLLCCHCVLGVEGGASILDFDGSIKKKTEEYVAQNPKADFEDVERHCFPNMDGGINLKAISPRHLEACMTRTCQVLLEGEYNGILKPGVHYIELKSDYSNLDEVLEQINDAGVRLRITNQAYSDIVLSNAYTYRSFIEAVSSDIIQRRKEIGLCSYKDNIKYGVALAAEFRNWCIVSTFRFLQRGGKWLYWSITFPFKSS